jgi:hypothetical protein
LRDRQLRNLLGLFGSGHDRLRDDSGNRHAGQLLSSSGSLRY